MAVVIIHCGRVLEAARKTFTNTHEPRYLEDCTLSMELKIL